MPNKTPPVLIYDDHCGFCRRWAGAAKYRIPDLSLLKGSEAPRDYPRLTAEELQKTVVLIDREGVWRRGADAAYKLLAEIGRPRAHRLYLSSALFKKSSDAGYRLVSRWRRPLSLVMDLVFGPPRGA